MINCWHAVKLHVFVITSTHCVWHLSNNTTGIHTIRVNHSKIDDIVHYSHGWPGLLLDQQSAAYTAYGLATLYLASVELRACNLHAYNLHVARSRDG